MCLYVTNLLNALWARCGVNHSFSCVSIASQSGQCPF